jgi:hypothetical protein
MQERLSVDHRGAETGPIARDVQVNLRSTVCGNLRSSNSHGSGQLKQPFDLRIALDGKLESRR